MTDDLDNLTQELNDFVQEKGIDIFGIGDVDYLNQMARPGRRLEDLFPGGQAVLIFGCGIDHSLARAWVKSGRGKYLTLTMTALENRKWLIKDFLARKGYRTFGGEFHGGGIWETGIRLGEAGASAGLGYIGKNNMLITPKYGPRVNLAYLVTDAPLQTTVVTPKNECGTCAICEKYCTSKAILGDGYFHGRACESVINCMANKIHLTSQVTMDCDMCQRMCPQGEIKYSKIERQGTWWDKLEQYQ
ncbi:MAG: hypothetical protein PHI41_08990 [Erysipelotrichaceae bacterium]|nr:hypothetical protein [Erysipelotrichaceae bacterium]MDD3809321.1 hypothetical protein [Erysipelotrichaceae bacterium]